MHATKKKPLGSVNCLKAARTSYAAEGCSGLWVEFKCPLCGKDLDDDKTMANFLVCGESSHGLLRFFTGDGCYFTTNEQVAEELTKKGKRVHIVDPKDFFGSQTIDLE